MIRWARNHLAAILLTLAGGLVLVAGSAVVTIPADSPAQGTDAVTDSTLTPAVRIAPDDTSIQPTGSTSTTSTTPAATAISPPTTRPIEEVLAEAAELRPPPHRATRVRIGKIDVDATIIDLGLNPDRTLEVPEDVRLTGWWTGRSVPGEAGPSIVVGHVDSARQGPGVFFRLRELDIGDVIHVERSDGSVAEFRVTETELVLKDQFPTDKVYGSVEGSKLRLITCGGTFDQSARSYVGNVIVYAQHVGTTQPPPPQSLDSVL